MNSLEGKNILITGGAGYLAGALIKKLRRLDCRIISLDQKSLSPWLKGEGLAVKEIEADIAKKETWEELLPGTDIVFHFAAQTSVYVANDNPVRDLGINVLPMIFMLEACRQNKLRPVVLFSGTATETGIPDSLPVDELYPDNPITVYDLHKLISEKYLKCYVAQGIVRGAILRLANVYGPGPLSSSADRGVLNIMIRRALRGEDLTLYGQGEFKRDYIYIEDVVDAFLLAAEKIDSINGGHFVLGSAAAHTLKEAFNLVADRVAERTGRRVKVVSVLPSDSLSPIENRNFVANSQRFSNLTDWSPRYSLGKGIDSTIDFLQAFDGEKK